MVVVQWWCDNNVNDSSADVKSCDLPGTLNLGIFLEHIQRYLMSKHEQRCRLLAEMMSAKCADQVGQRAGIDVH
jgi:hypothetical protein